MSMKTLEAAILAEAREVLKNRKLRQKDIAEWSTGEIEAHDGEVVVHLIHIGAYAAVKTEHDKRPKPEPPVSGGGVSQEPNRSVGEQGSGAVFEK